MDQDTNNRVIKLALRYVLRVVVLLAIIAGVSWLLFFRSSGKHASTTDTTTTAARTSQGKVAAGSTSSTTTGKTSTTAPTDGKNLADTGPADVAAVFGVAVVAGTLAWQWRLRRAAATS